jgi:hypothetical protein
MRERTEGRRRSIDADIDYFTSHMRRRGHMAHTRWDMQGGRRMTAQQGSGASLRVSDAERNEVADMLSAHFADGRLDQAEFKDRLDAAMAAKTQGDLAGLFDDLPPLASGSPPLPPRRRRRLAPVLCMVALLALAAGSTVSSWRVVHVPWLLLGAVVFFIWARSGRRHRRPHADRSYG